MTDNTALLPSDEGGVKHTAGPWRVDPRRSDTVLGDAGTVLARAYAPRSQGVSQGIANAVSAANARLIAAAPGLYEALKTLTGNIEQAWPHLMHLAPLVAARAALAKAEPR